ncbi:hypothetical protein ATK17_2222 [Branchiibius hedensis]|uniref:Membrane protein YfhO n=1 Tax=Branchiibius hedensis TaxID=672460 RepID=A0A2Y8ZR69_9MICO|nr:hypothetical protein [Branchiibius hedensis]PWJ26078.1 hypothetical protein ATK17_2222 [Branchiibius hedensis]SSA34890.1 hypothetical protein SAMN04489750_2222 [Branchiibius hedensis]
MTAPQGRTGRLRSPAVISVLCVTVVVLLANASYLLRIRTDNPMLYYSGLGDPEPGLVYGATTIDANYGWTVQALGHLAATTWFDGQVPLWNLYEGLGQPLAGEMQSAALFLPFILLQALPGGAFLMHVVLEFVAAFTMLGFLRSLRLSWTAATAGACIFGLNGAFSVMTNAPFNPIAFLPMALWGVELIGRAVREHRRPALGLWVLAFAFAFMLFAGFPETALLEGLFTAGWAFVRLTSLPGRRRPFAGWTVLAVVAGVALALPAIVAFTHFLSFGFTGYHEGNANDFAYPGAKITSLALPYAVGATGNAISHGQAGYLTLVTLIAAVVGLLGRRSRMMQAFLVLVVTILVLNMFGLSLAQHVVNAVPGLRNILVAKYGLILIEFAVAICAAYGIDDLRNATVRRWTVLLAAVLAVGYAVTALVFAAREGVLVNHRWTAAAMTWTTVACACLVVLFLLVRSRPARAHVLALAAAGIVVVNAAGTYAVPQLSASPNKGVDLAPVEFLQANLGTSRFFTLGPIEANYGSYWRIAQLNANDLPVPQKYADLVINELRPDNWSSLSPFVRGQYIPYRLVVHNQSVKVQRILLAGYGEKQAVYRQAGVKYLVTRPGVVTPADAQKYDLTKAFSNGTADIWYDAKSSPYYTTTAGCTVQQQTLSDVTLDCPQATTLVRRQLSSPGWTATINGTAHHVADSKSQLYQSISVPAGKSTVSFSYRPAHFVPAVAISLFVVLLMVLNALYWLVRRRRVAQPGNRST